MVRRGALTPDPPSGGLQPVRTRLFRLAASLVVAIVVLPVASASPSVAVQSPHAVVVSADPANTTPNITNGRVNAITQVGNRIIVGGTFTSVQNAGSSTTLTRNRILAFNATTGVIDTQFRPNLDGAVEALTPGPDGTSVIVGGSFDAVNGNGNYRRLVRLQVPSGAPVTTFQPRPNRMVNDVVQRNGALYVAGEFTTIGGRSRTVLARLDPTSGVVDPNLDVTFADPSDVPDNDPPKDGRLLVWRIDVSPNGDTLVAAGNFQTVAGQTRRQIAMLDLTTSPVGLSSWATDVFPFLRDPATSYCSRAFPWWIRDLDIAPDGSYVAVATTGANRPNRLCDSITRWEMGRTGPGQLPTWEVKSGGDSFHSVSVTGAAIYAGGHQQWMNNPFNPNECGRCDGPFPGGVPRPGLSAHDPINGLPFSWNPVRNPRGKGVLAQLATTTGLYLGSDTDRIAGETRRKLAFMPVAGGLSVPPNTPYTLPGSIYRIVPGGGMEKASFDGSTLGALTPVATGVNWNGARGAFALNGVLTTGWVDGTLRARTFDGTTTGAATSLNLYGLDVAPDPLVFSMRGANLPIPALDDHLTATTGMAFDAGRLFYTVSGEPRLYYRYYTPQSQIVGAELFVASTGDGVDWASVAGFTIASGRLLFALADGSLNSVAWNGTAPTGPVTKLAPAGSGWASRALFVMP
jgi:hypothetical protein